MDPVKPPEGRGKVLHCWEDSPDHHHTCMLEHGHEGDHEFTPDSQIGVRFTDSDGNEVDISPGWQPSMTDPPSPAETSTDMSGAGASPPCETLLRNLVIAVDRYVESDERPRPSELWKAMMTALREAEEAVYPL
jgi:hypothetical protein